MKEGKWICQQAIARYAKLVIKYSLRQSANTTQNLQVRHSSKTTHQNQKTYVFLPNNACKYCLEVTLQFENQKKHIQLCYLCAFKMELSNTFKEQYEKTVNRQMTIKKTLTICFICDTKDWKLIKTESEPGQFSTSMAVFMESVLTPRAFKQCAVCMYCLYHFHIWLKLRTTIFNQVSVVLYHLVNFQFSYFSILSIYLRLLSLFFDYQNPSLSISCANAY